MVGVVFALLFVEHVHGTYKWMILLRHTASHVPFWPMLKIRYLSAFIGTFGLGAVTIELVRMYGLARYTNDLAMSFTSILMDRLLGLTGLSLMILIGVVMESRERVAGIEFWAMGALMLILAGWLAIMNPAFRGLTDKMLSGRWLSMVRDKQNIAADRNSNRVYKWLSADELCWFVVGSNFPDTLSIAVCHKLRAVFTDGDVVRKIKWPARNEYGDFALHRHFQNLILRRGNNNQVAVTVESQPARCRHDRQFDRFTACVRDFEDAVKFQIRDEDGAFRIDG